MATKSENIELELAHFNNFKQYLSYYNQYPDATQVLVEAGLLQVSTAFEHAGTECDGHTVISVDHADSSNGDDFKMATVRTHGYGEHYSANVSNTKNKTGDLKVEIWERKRNQFYYFVIPYTAYSSVSASSNIDIPFELDGTPRKVPKRKLKHCNWWDYQVESFLEMARLDGEQSNLICKIRRIHAGVKSGLIVLNEQQRDNIAKTEASILQRASRKSTELVV